MARLSKGVSGFLTGEGRTAIGARHPGVDAGFGNRPDEKKIRATVENARTILDLAKEHGSVKAYIAGFGKREGKLLEDLQYKFKHMGPATARVFLWSVGFPLTPSDEEKRWMKGHPDHD